MINRSSFLRVFDQTIAGKIMNHMVGENLKALEKSNISNISRTKEGDLMVELLVDGQPKKAKVDSILLAIGRDPNTSVIRNSGVKLNERSMKIQGRKEEPERTNVDQIYALGDVLEDVPELMPVAQKSGKLLAHRIFQRIKGKMTEEEILKKYSMDYNHIATTVFSTVEYSFVGLNEEEAIKQYGEDNIEIYHREVTPLEVSIYSNNMKTAYMKLIVERTEEERVIGIHYLGPNAGEVINGFALAMKMGVKKDDLDTIIGIHPTVSEDFFNLDITKRSGKDYMKTDC
jgi:thioredoxin reductase (NADPH)